MRRKKKRSWLWIFPVCALLIFLLVTGFFVYEKMQVDTKKVSYQELSEEVTSLESEVEILQNQVGDFKETEELEIAAEELDSSGGE